MPFSGETRKVKSTDLLEFAKIHSVCFEYSNVIEQDAQAYYEKLIENKEAARTRLNYSFMDRYVAEYDDHIIAGLSALPYTIEFDGKYVGMMGIGDVCTLPHYRKLGAIRALFGHALHDAYDAGIEWSLLYPFSQAYYEKFGYTVNEPYIVWEFNLKTVKPNNGPPYKFSLYDGGEDISGFLEAYKRMSGFNMMVHRERCDYGKLLNANPYASNNFAYLCHNEDNTACGYIIWHKIFENNNSVMNVTELVFDSFQTLQALINFAAGFSSDYNVIRFTVPSGINIESLCADYNIGRLKRSMSHCGMMRVVHIENALKAAKLRGTGEAVIYIDDVFLDKQFKLGVSWRDNELIDIGDTRLSPHAHVSIGVFSELLLGRYDLCDFTSISASEFRDIEKFSGLFYRKAIHTKDFF